MTHFAHIMTSSTAKPIHDAVDWCLSDATLPFLVGCFEAAVVVTFSLVLSGAIG